MLIREKINILNIEINIHPEEHWLSLMTNLRTPYSYPSSKHID